MKSKIAYTGLMTCILLLVLIVGQAHWNKKIEQTTTTVLANGRGNFITPFSWEDNAEYTNVNEDILALKNIINDYEEQFGEVLAKYEEEMNHLFLKAEQEYYMEVFPHQGDFRNFVLDYSKQSELLTSTSEKMYFEIYEAFSKDLVSLGYLADEAFIYYLIFEEITETRQISFVTELISLQSH